MTFQQYLRAQFKAQNVTVDFREGGALGMWVNQIVPFFNAAVQGPARMAHSIRQNPGDVLLRGALWITLPTLFLWWLHKDDEWYVTLSPMERYRYWHFQVPGTETRLRIPKPFEWGHVFGSIPEAALDAAYRQDPTAVREALGTTLSDLVPPFLPGLAQPSLEIFANRRSRDGRVLVGKSLERLPPGKRSSPHTTETAREIGRLFGVPPVYIEHFVEGHTGGLVPDLVRGGERLAYPALRDRVRPPEMADTPVAGRMFLRQSQTRVFDDFYRHLETLQQSKASKDPTTVSPDAGDLLRMDRASKRLTALRKEAREVIESGRPDDVRRRELLAIDAEMREKAVDAMQGATYSGRFYEKTAK